MGAGFSHKICEHPLRRLKASIFGPTPPSSKPQECVSREVAGIYLFGVMIVGVLE